MVALLCKLNLKKKKLIVIDLYLTVESYFLCRTEKFNLFPLLYGGPVLPCPYIRKVKKKKEPIEKIRGHYDQK